MSDWILIPKNYQPDTLDSRKESGLEYIKMVPLSALESANAEIAALKKQITDGWSKDCEIAHTALESENAKLAAQVADFLAALQDANEFTSSILENMEYYFDNRCCPTADEVNICAIADSQIRYVLAKHTKLKGGENE